MTFNEPICARSAMRPSVIPSPRYELSGLLARSWKGSTAIAVTALAPGRAPAAFRPGTSHHAAAATSTPAPSAAISRPATRVLDGLRDCTDTAVTVAPSDDSSAARNRSIEAKRSAGTFAIAFMMAPSTAGGTVWRTTRRLGTGSSECRAMMAWDDGPVNGRLTTQHLVQGARQTVLVAATVHRGTGGLFRAHVLRCSHDHTGQRELLRARGVQGPCDAEIGNHGLPAGQHDVFRLDIAVDDAVLVGVLQGAADFAGDLERGVEWQLLFPREPLPERLALGERHHVVQQATGRSRVEQREDVRVLERRRNFDLAEESLAADDGRQLGLEQLDRDAAPVLQVLGEKDDRHPTVADLTLDPVSIAQRRRELLEQVHGLVLSASGTNVPLGAGA